MAPRKLKGAAPVLTEALRQQLAQSLVPIRRDEVPIYRGQERRPIFAVESPAHGRGTAKTCSLIHDCSKQRNLESDKPGALRINKTAVSGYLAAEPVLKYDQFTPDLYELTWPAGRSRVDIDLLPILQPRNLEVPQGYVTEIPVSLETLNGKAYLILHLDAAETRTIQEMSEEQKAAMAATKSRKGRKSGKTMPDQPAETNE